jgi:hypothetical protein
MADDGQNNPDSKQFINYPSIGEKHYNLKVTFNIKPTTTDFKP